MILLGFRHTAVSAVCVCFRAARLDCGVTLEGGSLTLTKEAPPFRREERRARSEYRLDRRRVCEIARHGMPSPKLAIASTVAWAPSRSDR
jgi:hypothetical protein